MTTISGGGSGRRPRRARHRRPAVTGPVGVGSRRYWLWSSTVWTVAVAASVAVAAAQAVTVGILGLAVAGLCGALSSPEPPAATRRPPTRPAEGIRPGHDGPRAGWIAEGQDPETPRGRP